VAVDSVAVRREPVVPVLAPVLRGLVVLVPALALAPVPVRALELRLRRLVPAAPRPLRALAVPPRPAALVLVHLVPGPRHLPSRQLSSAATARTTAT
jgi:hypothetical protein